MRGGGQNIPHSLPCFLNSLSRPRLIRNPDKSIPVNRDSYKFRTNGHSTALENRWRWRSFQQCNWSAVIDHINSPAYVWMYTCTLSLSRFRIHKTLKCRGLSTCGTPTTLFITSTNRHWNRAFAPQRGFAAVRKRGPGKALLSWVTFRGRWGSNTRLSSLVPSKDAGYLCSISRIYAYAKCIPVFRTIHFFSIAYIFFMLVFLILWVARSYTQSPL